MWTVSAPFGELRRQPRLVTHRPSSTRERGRQHGPRSRVLEASVRPRHSLARSSEKTVARGLKGFVNCCSTAQPDLKSPRRVGPRLFELKGSSLRPEPLQSGERLVLFRYRPWCSAQRRLAEQSWACCTERRPSAGAALFPSSLRDSFYICCLRKLGSILVIQEVISSAELREKVLSRRLSRDASASFLSQNLSSREKKSRG